MDSSCLLAAMGGVSVSVLTTGPSGCAFEEAIVREAVGLGYLKELVTGPEIKLASGLRTALGSPAPWLLRAVWCDWPASSEGMGAGHAFSLEAWHCPRRGPVPGRAALLPTGHSACGTAGLARPRGSMENCSHTRCTGCRWHCALCSGARVRAGPSHSRPQSAIAWGRPTPALATWAPGVPLTLTAGLRGKA